MQNFHLVFLSCILKTQVSNILKVSNKLFFFGTSFQQIFIIEKKGQKCVSHPQIQPQYIF